MINVGITLCLDPQISGSNLLFLEHLHCIHLIGILLSDHEHFSESASANYLDQVEIVCGDFDGWVQEILGVLYSPICRLSIRVY